MTDASLVYLSRRLVQEKKIGGARVTMPPHAGNLNAPASSEADRGTKNRQDGKSVPHIIDLRAQDSSSAPAELSFRREILQGLTRDTVLVPGNTPADYPFAYSKVIPTGKLEGHQAKITGTHPIL